MKNRTKVLLLIILIGLLLVSCVSKFSEKDQMLVCARYSVPGLLRSDLKSSNVIECIETDSYGRKLCKYTCDNAITNKEETVFVICQKFNETEESIYFYEDKNYTFLDDEKDISLLKEQNDWEKPIDESKMSKRTVTITFDHFMYDDSEVLEANKAKKAIKTLFAEKENAFVWMIDTDNSAHAMYIIRFEENGWTRQYFAIVDAEYNVSVMEIELVDGFIDKEAYANFKKDNGWIYG